MKKIFISLLTISMLLILGSCGKKGKDYSNIRIGMVVSYGDVTDQTYNQTIYQSCRDFSKENDVEFKYYKSNGDHTSDIVEAIELAIEEKCNIIILPGYSYTESLAIEALAHEDVRFIVFDITEDDYMYYTERRLNNIYTINFKEELAGFMAGYTTVRLGYRKLGVLGGVDVPSVIRYGYGFLQGADFAAKELNLNDVEVNYAYGNQFFGDADINKVMDKWYENGTQVIFACGGAIYTSPATSAKKYNGKIVGVDVDQSDVINSTYADQMTVTSAMKGLEVATKDALITNIENISKPIEKKNDRLGIVSDDPEKNYVGIPLETTQFNDKFTVDDYKNLVLKMYNKEIQVSDDIIKEPEEVVTNITVNNYGLLK